jgi:hypothetical protein
MITCPYCSFKNEEGTLFCEQCKSDLTSLPEPKVMNETSALAEGPPVVETLPVSDVPMAEPIGEAGPETVEAPAIEPAHEPVMADTATNPPLQSSTTDLPALTDTASNPPVGTSPKLIVIRGLRINAEYPIYPGDNFIGRTDEKPVDIDLETQESPDRIWCSRQHAKIVSEQNGLTIEDLGSQNGTFVNRARIYPGQVRPLNEGDVVQIGTVQMKVTM